MYTKQGKAFKVKEKKLSCLERDLNPQSPAYQDGALTTKPPRQLSSLGTCTCTYISVYNIPHSFLRGYQPILI